MAKMIINGEVYSGSTNYASAITYIKEDGTKSTVQKELDYRPVNNNLLINSNFANPVNQRAFTSVELTQDGTGIFTIDRWKIWKGGSSAAPKLTVNKGYLTLTGTTLDDDATRAVWIFQDVENMNFGVHTISVKLNGKVYSETFNNDGTTLELLRNDGVGFIIGSRDDGDTAVAVAILLDIIPSANIEWVKLEEGEVATPYVPRPFVDEYLSCIRYFYAHGAHGTGDINLGGGYIMSAAANEWVLGNTVSFPVQMRAKPTVYITSANPTDDNPLGTVGSISKLSDLTEISGVEAMEVSPTTFGVIRGSGGLTKNEYYYFTYIADAEL